MRKRLGLTLSRQLKGIHSLKKKRFKMRVFVAMAQKNHFWSPKEPFGKQFLIEPLLCPIFPYYIVWKKKKNSMHSIHTIVFKKLRFWSPMRPKERIYEWQWSDASDAGRSRDSNSMAIVVRRYFIHTAQPTFILYRMYFLMVAVPTQTVCKGHQVEMVV